MSERDNGSWRPWLRPLIIFGVCVAGFSLVSWNYLEGPSKHFHFVDLAHSFLEGHLNTFLPDPHWKGKKDAPQDLKDAIKRHTSSSKGEKGGWNDWASYKVLTLKGGHVVKGAFPWGNTQDAAKKQQFVTFEGDIMLIDLKRDLDKNCQKKYGHSCDQTKYYVSFPPFPAFVMMPLYLVWGYDVHDVLVTIFFGALSAMLLYLLLELLRKRGYSKRSPRENMVLTFLFAFGTVFFFSTIRGEVWFTALVIGSTLNILYIYFALDTRHPLLAGIFLALGMATRTPIAFASVFFGLQLLFPDGHLRRSGWGKALAKGALFALPILVVGGLLMYYNYLRFENPFEFGHTYLMAGQRASIRDHGLFSFWFLNNNLPAALTNFPVFVGEAPFIKITKHGLGLLVSTPVFFYLLWPEKGRPRLHRLLWLSVLAVAVPLLLYQNTGWAQFGYRFAIDFFPFVFALLAIGGRKMTRTFWVLFALSVVINLFGAATFGRASMFYY